jgi:hypothetical protein
VGEGVTKMSTKRGLGVVTRQVCILVVVVIMQTYR